MMHSQMHGTREPTGTSSRLFVESITSRIPHGSRTSPTGLEEAPSAFSPSQTSKSSIPAITLTNLNRTLGSVANSFRNKFAGIADSPDPALFTAGYQYIPVDVHVPILEIPNLPTKPLPRHLSRAVIQGTLNGERRDYRRFFRDLIASLHGTPATLTSRILRRSNSLRTLEDPGAWGYNPLQDRHAFVPNYESAIPPFELLLVGAGSIEIPPELAYIVSIHHDLTYKEFYASVASCDVVVPAFAEFGCECRHLLPDVPRPVFLCRTNLKLTARH